MNRACAAACLFSVVVCLALIACGGAAPPSATPTIGAGGALPTPTNAGPTATPAAVPAAPASGSAAPSASAAATATATAPPTPTRTPTVTPTATPRMVMAISPGAERYTIAPQKSKAVYRVGEKFLGQGISVRVATVTGVTGDLYIDRQRPTASSVSAISVDIRGMTSDMPGHDGARNDYLDTRRYPNTVFTPKRLLGLPETPYAEGAEVTFQIVGEMVVGQGKSEVAFDVTGKIVGTTFTGTAKAKVLLTDFGYEVPQMTALELDNNVYLEIELVAERVG